MRVVGQECCSREDEGRAMWEHRPLTATSGGKRSQFPFIDPTCF